MDTNNKFSKFVAKLERKMLDGNKESMVLIGVQTSQIWGGSNAAGCTNSTFIFLPTLNTNAKKIKELFFANARKK